jgi:3-hydroxybutyryl-CoA dehydratase
MIRKKFEDIQIGEKVSFGKTITEADVFAFAGITADFNPIHVNVEFAQKSFFGKRVAHGMLTASLINQTLTNIGGLGTIHLTQTVKSSVTNQEGKTVLEGEALIMMPK